MPRTLAMVLAGLFWVGCEDGSPKRANPTPFAPKQLSADDLKIAKDEAHKSARTIIPSPREVERLVRHAGVAQSLAPLVPQRTFDLGPEVAVDLAAMRTGVLLADTVLTAHTADDASLTARLASIRMGLVRIGAGAGLLKTVDEVTESIKQGSTDRDDMLRQMEEISEMMVPEEGWGPGDTTGPLLQAGTWLAGSNLVSRAILESKRTDAADELLRESEVVAYFLEYAKGEGDAKGTPELRTILVRELTNMHTITSKEHLSTEDVQSIERSTAAVLALL